MHRTSLTAVAFGLLSTLSVFAEDSVVETRTDRVRLFEVPFRCEAAPDIGCGSLSKPVLLELERDPTISEAWLDGTGTILAVIGSETASRQSTYQAVQSVLQKNGVTCNELVGDPYAVQLKSFTTEKDWYRGAEVDALSKIEARTIALRIVRRVQASVTLAPHTTAALEADIASAFERRFVGSSKEAGPVCQHEQLVADITAAARANLNEKEAEALKVAFAKGIRPLLEDDETAKSKSGFPDCCRPRSQTAR
jgi:hypothetical protein